MSEPLLAEQSDRADWLNASLLIGKYDFSLQVVFNSVMRWVRYDLEDRRHHLPELLRGIRLALLPSECLLEAVACEELVMADKRSR